MRIYGDLVSGNCLKVKIVADYLRLSYRWVPIDILKGESRTPDYLSRFPAGQVVPGSNSRTVGVWPNRTRSSAIFPAGAR